MLYRSLEIGFSNYDREQIEFDAAMVTVVSKSGLIAMKKAAGRLQDLAVVESLEEVQRDD